jgi:hypothetical protein
MFTEARMDTEEAGLTVMAAQPATLPFSVRGGNYDTQKTKGMYKADAVVGLKNTSSVGTSHDSDLNSADEPWGGQQASNVLLI